MLAWHVGVLGRVKKFPQLAEILGTQRKQTASDQEAALRLMAEQYGIPLRKGRSKRTRRVDG